MATPSRKRVTNFTQREEALLTNAVKMYASAIESRKTDADNNRIRNDAWDSVCNIFNETSVEQYRNVATLRNKYKNMKKAVAKNLGDEKKHMYKTGGGPPKEYTFSQTDRNIIEISGAQMTGQASEFDDDVVYRTPRSVQQIVPHEENDLNMLHLEEPSCSTICNKKLPDKQQTPQLVTPTVTCAITTTTVSNIVTDTVNSSTSGQSQLNSWSSYTPDKLRKPISKPLRARDLKEGGESLRGKLSKWACSKKDLADLQIKCFMQEHELKMKHMQEKHEEFLKNQRCEMQENLQMKAENHALEIRLLKKQLNE